ncbi:hypothetical protein [Nocardia sp. bgisy134]|uniref:hypothetical protein n=1 Tax=Nocardia sp. bgisy134 TaxID=3413789 RepID=UPI003D7500F6
MYYIDAAKDQLTDLVGKLRDAASRTAGGQTVTVARPRAEVERFWRDPENLSRVLGDIGDVSATSPADYEWTLLYGDEGVLTWQTMLVTEEDGLRFVDVAEDGAAREDGPEIGVYFADAPRGLGTEVTIRAAAPLPGFLAGAAAFKALYRARALMQTGELPTLEHDPSTWAAAR